MIAVYTFKNFTELSEQESEEILRGRNDPEVRRWMVTDRVIGADEHQRFMSSLSGNEGSCYVRIERNGVFSGVYSLNKISSGAAEGGFWVTPFIRERLLALNIAFYGMQYMFLRHHIDFIYGYYLNNNIGAARINELLGFRKTYSKRPSNNEMRRIEITRAQWMEVVATNRRLKTMLNRAEQLNQTDAGKTLRPLAPLPSDIGLSRNE